jgi:hypothetical protein
MHPQVGRGGYGRHQVRQSLGGVMAKTQPRPTNSWSWWIPDNAIPCMKFLSVDGCYQFNKATKLPLQTVIYQGQQVILDEPKPTDRS